MLSKIRIDINEKNEPIILVEWVNSDDIRDKLVKRFIEGFGHDSNEALMKFEDQKPGEYVCISISPVRMDSGRMTSPEVFTLKD